MSMFNGTDIFYKAERVQPRVVMSRLAEKYFTDQLAVLCRLANDSRTAKDPRTGTDSYHRKLGMGWTSRKLQGWIYIGEEKTSTSGIKKTLNIPRKTPN